jgi:UDP-N-acetylmuramyl pentapeptide phosphotransferase/UDP-N-acetylglucosamine-1-phosphate transferase
MKLSLSNLLLLVAIIAVATGWWSDRRKLSHEIETLNAECADSIQQISHLTMANGFSSLSFPDGKLPPQRSYDLRKPEDRHEYRKVYGHLMSPFGLHASAGAGNE